MYSGTGKKEKKNFSLSRGFILMPLLIFILTAAFFSGKACAAEATETMSEDNTEMVLTESTAKPVTETETEAETEEIPKPDADTLNKVEQYLKSAGIYVDGNAYMLMMNNPAYYAASGRRQEKEESEEEEDDPPSRQKKYSTKNFVIDDYDVYIRVNENNTLEITEKLKVWFNSKQHGIYRTIPLDNEILRPDGTKTEIRAGVSDINVNEKYKTSYSGKEVDITIGDEDETVTGEKNYEISYTYNLGKDQVDGADELYFNIIGTGWKTVIGHVSFTVDMPKSFDSSKLDFAAGWRASSNNTGIEYEVEGSRIKGEYNKILLAGEAVTIRLELPEGYFTGARLGNIVFDIVMYSLPVFFLIISLLLWKRYGKDDMVVETVEFYPPDGLNSLSTAFLYKGDVAHQDVSSLLIYLADKGYLQIEESERKVAFWKEKSFRIIKIRDYDGVDPEEKKFFEGLFRDAEEVNGETAVTSGQLYDRFYTTTEEIIRDVKSAENMDKVFETGTAGKSLLIGIFTVISVFAIFIPPVFTYTKPVMILLLFLPVISFGIILGVLLRGKGRGYRKGKMKRARMNIPGRLLAYMVTITGICPLFALILPLCRDVFYIIGALIGACCIVGMIICLIYMPRRTPYGIRMLGRIEGFRNFLETAEKDRLEEMVMSDPQYFFHILPYTYVLGVSDVWIKKFEDIQLQDPGWCRMTYYDVHTFGSFMDHTMATADRALSAPASGGGYGGGGGFSGGGFAGGGSGGGGGGAW